MSGYSALDELRRRRDPGGLSGFLRRAGEHTLGVLKGAMGVTPETGALPDMSTARYRIQAYLEGNPVSERPPGMQPTQPSPDEMLNAAVGGIAAPIGGNIGLLGKRIPKVGQTVDEQMAEVGYKMGSAPGVYSHATPPKAAARPTKLQPSELATLEQYRQRLLANGMPEEQAASTVSTMGKTIADYRTTHHPQMGWRQLDLDPANFKGNKPAYKGMVPEFHLDPSTGRPFAGEARAKQVEDISNKMVAEVEDVIRRAGEGDPNAQFIVDQARWYKDATKTIKGLFGEEGGAKYSDIQGAMSPNTKLSEQHKAADEIYKRLVNGDFDEKLARFDEHMARKPEGVPDAQWARKVRDDESIVLTKENGKKYGMNGVNALLAIRDLLHRSGGPGTAPKMRNFAGNLRGTSIDPTIDIWAGRDVNRLSGGARVPPLVDMGVPGVHAQPKEMLPKDFYERAIKARAAGEPMSAADAARTGDPGITGQYGLAHDIYRTAAQKLGIDPADLQAMRWFNEKYLWEKRGWTNVDRQPSLVDLIKRDNPR